MRSIQLLLCLSFLSITNNVLSQKTDSTDINFPEKYLDKVSAKVSGIENKLNTKTIKALERFKKQQAKLQRLLSKTDSVENTTVTSAPDKIKQLQDDFKNVTGKISSKLSGQYNAYLDTLSSSLAFLQKGKNVISQSKEVQNKLNDAFSKVSLLQNKLLQTEKIKQYIKERKDQFKNLLAKYTTLPSNIRKQYEKLSKTAYYYSAQIKEYKEMLKDPKKIEQKALAFLNKLPAFQKFMKENSQLASLFQIPGNNNTAQNLAGLQTRASVQGLITQRVSMGGPNAMTQIQQNLAQGHAEIDKLKDRINKLGGSSSDIEMPDFKPNDQKTKSFLKRLEFGSNLQSQKADRFFPVTTDIGLSVGYKLNNKSILGIGASYKMGWGKGFNNIHITSQGVGLRSFFDYKIKNSFFISGGYEQNYKSAFNSMDALKNYSAWQTSGLIGISKKYKISKKFKGNMQLLWDFLSYHQIPRTQPIIYRLGYLLK